MKLNAAYARIAAIVGALGLSAAVKNLNAILLPVIHALGLPEGVLNLPAPVKLAVVITAAVYALIVTKRTAEHNPDGTPAVEPYRPENQ